MSPVYIMKTEFKKKEFVMIEMKPEEKADITKIAKIRGIGISTFCRYFALIEARKALKELSQEEFKENEK